MDPGIPHVPITTLAGVASLTDCKAALPAEYSILKVLPELPLPTPSPQTISNKSLLFHPRVAEEAQNLLGHNNEGLVPQLVASLEITTADDIEVKDNYAGADSRLEQKDGMPHLLKAIIDLNPEVFNGKGYQHPSRHQRQTQPSQQFLRRQELLQESQSYSSQATSSEPQSQNSQYSEAVASQASPLEASQLPETFQPTLDVPEHKLPEPQPIEDYPQMIPEPYSANNIPTSVIQHAEPVRETENSPEMRELPQLNTSHIMEVDIPTPVTPSPVISEVISTIAETATNIPGSNLINSVPSGSNYVTTTSELRQLRRPSTRGQPILRNTITEEPQPLLNPTSLIASTNSQLLDLGPLSGGQKDSCMAEQEINASASQSTNTRSIKQPVVRIVRISDNDQSLILESLQDFVETKPKLAKQLGIQLNRPDYNEDSDIENKERGTKRKATKKAYRESDDEYNPQEDLDATDTFSVLVGKRRKVATRDEAEPESFVLSKPKLRRVERKFVTVQQKLSNEELMESNTYVRFNKSVEHVLRTAEDIDFAEIANDDMIQDEYLLSRSIMSDLCTEAAKLKVLGAMEMIPTDKLIRLLTILELNIRGGDRISPITDEANESVRQYWLETTMDRVLGAADACLICLNIMTSPNMSKKVYLEEIMDRVVLYIKYHLSNTIFPSYDSTYKLDNKKKDGRKKKSTPGSGKGIAILYTKISELVNLLSELLNIQILTDMSVLHASSMGISPFFVENVSELQLACLKLVTLIFTKYEAHRRLLLDDILASIARLPSTKRSLRTYRLNSEEHIQMLTALVLQLIQCVVALEKTEKGKRDKEKREKEANQQKVDDDILVCNKFEKATITAGTFLKVFLSKCGSKTQEIDYRPLFENFVQDLLCTVNKPEWPATELLLCLLGKMLMQNFANKGTDMSLRVASLDYLGVVAARLRRDSVLSRCKLNSIDQMIKDIRQEEMKDNDEVQSKKKKKEMTNDERTQFLQRILLDFLAVNSQNDESLKYARHFYIAWWYKDLVSEKTQLINDEKKPANYGSRNGKANISDDEEDDEPINIEQENVQKFRIIEEKKKLLLSRIPPFQEGISSSSGKRVQVYQTYIDYNSAELVAQFLASKRYFSQSFDQYLKAILIVLKETSIAIRTKAMKCLTMIVEADPSVLARNDMQMGVNQSILDQSTSVREAAVDLIGKFILRRPELIDKYYEILSPRILDTGVSVRKRVIKILKDICIECPDFPKIPEICVKMIRRINDEEGIKKLVMEVFQNMWFTPTNNANALLRKVIHITDVVASSSDLEWFEQLLLSLYKPKEDKDDSTKINTEPSKVLLTACKQIVDCLIENILRLEEQDTSRSGPTERLLACVSTLLCFAKIRAQLLIKHASTLQPYLGLKCIKDGDNVTKIISCVARMLELVVPLMEHPSDSFLAQLEEDTIKLIFQHNRPIVSSCLSCLGSIINKVTHNFKLIQDCFKKFNTIIGDFKLNLETYNVEYTNHLKYRFQLRRALYVVGLLIRHFDFTRAEVLGDLPTDTKDQAFRNMLYFLKVEDPDFQDNALKAIGQICIRHNECMLEPELKEFYHRMLTIESSPVYMKVDILINIKNYLTEEENRMLQQDFEWSKRAKQENLKEMNDVSSGMASTVIQQYLQEIMKCYLHPGWEVRQPALQVIQLVCDQGLVHPLQFIPSLICMSTDTEKYISQIADKTLSDIDKKYPGFIYSQAPTGIEMSHKLQKIIQNNSVIRGFIVRENGEYPVSVNASLYALLRNSRQQRRALIMKILRHFDEQARSSLPYMLYLADNLAYFPYQVQDEALFIVHHIDLSVSNSGTNLLQSFREGLIPDQNKIVDSENAEFHNVVSALDEDDDEEALSGRLPENVNHLQGCLIAAQGCLLLLMLKQHIKDVYGLSDGKIQLYSPSEAVKVYEKAMPRKSNALFNPRTTLQKLKAGIPPDYLDENGRRDLIRQYLDFKQLMLQLDPADDGDEDKSSRTLINFGGNAALNTAVLTEADQVVLQNYKDQSPPKVPKMVISHRRFESETKRTPRSHRSSEKGRKIRHKKKRRKIASDSESDENDFSDPDFLV
ncbi:unnamed protein product [Ceutorhynchus assimilis]|uniref:Nipped-B protein n=1 Tax=Ceutorhynchus assimilis TaxID=467358 RepID=A0A9N9MBC0_9CUCU|nr:unnamed protein product [Ceutorhynchus assimilis]